ncbi:MAG: dTMP kinase [Candidatus Micrarchaeales archaeon]|jgi:dTMP kinase
MKGKFIVIEGIDGSGKSTQASLLYSFLLKKYKKVLLTKEPTYSIIGSLIRAALNKEWKTTNTVLQLLFCADRAHHLKSLMPFLRKGGIVISDRYAFSTIAYGSASGLDYKWLVDINSALPYPDLTIIIDISPQTALKRINALQRKKSLFEEKNFLTRVREFYLKIASEFKNVKVVDGEKSVEEVRNEIIKNVKKVLD